MLADIGRLSRSSSIGNLSTDSEAPSRGVKNERNLVQLPGSPRASHVEPLQLVPPNENRAITQLRYDANDLALDVGNRFSLGKLKNDVGFLGRTTYGKLQREARDYTANHATMTGPEKLARLGALQARIDKWQAAHGDGTGPAAGAKETAIAELGRAVKTALREVALTMVPEPTPVDQAPKNAKAIVAEVTELRNAVIDRLNEHIAEGHDIGSDEVRQDLAKILNDGTLQLRDDKEMAHLPVRDQAMILGLIKALDLGDLVMPSEQHGNKKAVGNLQWSEQAPLADMFDINNPDSDYSTKKSEFYQAVGDDATVKAAFAQVKQGQPLPMDQMREVARAVVAKQTEIFGFDPPDAINIYPDKASGGPGRGNYVRDESSINFNQSVFKGRNGLCEFIGSVAHENLHNWQHRVGDKIASGQITEHSNPDLYHTGQVFEFNSNPTYMLNLDNQGNEYKRTALERVAHDIGGEMASMSSTGKWTGLMGMLRDSDL
jgi:hypothetical protein